MVQLVGIALALLILGAGVLLPTASGLEQSMQRVLAIFLFVVVLWITQPIPYTISSVLAVTLLFAFGVTDSFAEAVSGFASTLVFFLFLLFLLGSAISKVGLDDRAARRLLSAQSTPRGSIRSLSANIYALSFLVPSAAARAVTFIPVVRRIRDAYDLGRQSNFERSSFLVLGHVNPIASMSLMTGGGMAIITSEVIRSSVRPITWVEWLVYMGPPVLVLYVIAAYAAERIYPVDDDTTVGDVDSSDDLSESVINEDHAADPLSREERIVAWVMVGTVIAWIAGSFIGTPTILPAVVAVAVLSMPNVGVITTEDVQDVSWGILFVIGAMFSILDVMETTGTLTVIVDGITWLVPFGSMTSWQVIAVLIGIAIVIRTFFSTASAAIVIVLPVVLEFAQVLEVNQFYLAFSILLTVGSTTFLPFNTTSVLLSFDQGPLTIREVLLFGCVTMICAFVVIPFAWLFYWPLVDGIWSF